MSNTVPKPSTVMRDDRAENSIMQTITIAVSAILIAAGLITAPGLINNARDNNARGDLANIAYAQEVLMADDGTYSAKVNKTDADIDGWYLGSQTNIKYTLSDDVDSSALVCNDPDWAYLLKAKSTSGNTFFRSSTAASTSQDVATLVIPPCISALAGYTDFIDTDFVSPVVMDLNNIAAAEDYAVVAEGRYFENVAPGQDDSLFDLASSVASVKYELSDSVSGHAALICDSADEAYLIRAVSDGTAVFRSSVVEDVSPNPESLDLPECITSNSNYANFVSENPVEVVNYLRFTELVVGQSGSKIALDENGNIWTWGNNSAGALGDGTTINRYIPEMIVPAQKFKSIHVGGNVVFAIDTSNHLWGWGTTGNGQLGDGTKIRKTSPVPIAPSQTFSKVSGGSSHTLALDTNGKLWAWGYNSQGRLGDNTTVDKLTPVVITPTETYKDISAGIQHSAAIRSDGRILTWGGANYGALGNGTADRMVPTLVPTPAGVKFTKIDSGRYHNFAIDESNKLWGWGNTDSGALGGTSSVAAPISSILFKDVTTTQYYSYGLSMDNELYSWGQNNAGQLGTGSTTSHQAQKISSPIKFSSLGTLSENSGAASAAIDANGEIWQWGSASGLTTDPFIHGGTATSPTKIRVSND